MVIDDRKISPEPGLRVRYLREQLGLTRKGFEDITGVKAHTLRHLETGTQALSPTTARVLANLFIYLFEIRAEEASEQYLLYGTRQHHPSEANTATD